MITAPFTFIVATSVAAASQLGPIAPPARPLAYVVPPLVAHGWEGPYEDGKGPAQVEKSWKTFTVSGDTTVTVGNFVGNVTVTGGPGNEVKLEIVKRAWGKDEAEAKRQLEAARVSVNQHTGRLEIRSMPGGPKHRIAIDFSLVVPAGANLEVNSMVGDLKITGVKGEVRAETVSGSVEASGLAGLVALKAVTGDVKLWSSASASEVAANSVSGNVMLKGVKARSLTCSTVSGSVTVANGAAERAVVRSVNGDVELVGGLTEGGRYELKSHAGDIRLVLDGKVGFQLEANTFNGDIVSELALTGVARTSSGDRYMKRKALHGTFGDGSAQVDVSSFNGSVQVIKVKKVAK
ncbi:MAG: DUF4097 family beta strand repeat protein [Vicinamibacteraceae bacterium]|nr:DUF4097 family beta strand repeat protein [Vicinamibacteraceae bacterium]